MMIFTYNIYIYIRICYVFKVYIYICENKYMIILEFNAGVHLGSEAAFTIVQLNTTEPASSPDETARLRNLLVCSAEVQQALNSL